MELILWILNIGEFIVAIYLLAYIFEVIATIFTIIKYKSNGATIDKKLWGNFNPLRLYKNLSHEFKSTANILMKIIFIIGLIAIAFDIIKVSPYGTTTIGSFIEKKEYTEYYYVNMFPEDSGSKNYRLNAQINARLDDEEGTNNEGDSFTRTVRHYYIQKAYFSNGGYITFYNNDEPLEVNNKVFIRDDEDNFWDIELTKEKAK